MGSKAKIKITKLFEVDEIPMRFANCLNENQKLFACVQQINQINEPEINGYKHFGTGNRLFYYVKNETE